MRISSKRNCRSVALLYYSVLLGSDVTSKSFSGTAAERENSNSFVPRCHGLCVSQKYTGIFVCWLSSECLANSIPRSHVSDCLSSQGMSLNALTRAEVTESASLPAILSSRVNRVSLSTNVAMCVFPDPVTKSSSQWAIVLRLSTTLLR